MHFSVVNCELCSFNFVRFVLLLFFVRRGHITLITMNAYKTETPNKEYDMGLNSALQDNKTQDFVVWTHFRADHDIIVYNINVYETV